MSHQLFPHHTHFVLMTFILSTQSDDQNTDQCVWSTWLDWSLLLHGCSSLFHSLGAQGTHPDVSIAFLSIKCCPCSTGGRVCVCVCVGHCVYVQGPGNSVCVWSHQSALPVQLLQYRGEPSCWFSLTHQSDLLSCRPV